MEEAGDDGQHGGGADTEGDVFVHIEQDGTIADDLNHLLCDRDVMPWISDDRLVNMIEEGLDVIVKIFPQHFKDGAGAPSNSELMATEFFRHALLWHDQRFARDIEFLFFAYHHEVKRKLMGVAVVADKNASTYEDLHAARRAAEANASSTQAA